MPVRIALCGEMGSGKDWWADVVVRELELEKVAIAETFKAMWNGIRELAGLPEDKHFARPFLQLMGNIGRAHNENIWVDTLMAKLKSEKGYVLSDLRFPNEAARLRELGFGIVRVETNETERRARLAARDGGHDAATELDDTERFIRDIVPDLVVRGEKEATEETRVALQRFIRERTATCAATDARLVAAKWRSECVPAGGRP